MMGATFSHISFKGANPHDVARVIREELPRRQCFVTLQDRKWVTVFDKLCNEQLYDEPIISLGSTVCRHCACEAVAFTVVHSDYLRYWVFNSQGEVIDESCPEDDRDEMPDEERFGLAGDPACIAALGADRGVTVQSVREVLENGTEGFMDTRVFSLALLLGMKYHCLDYDTIMEQSVRAPVNPEFPYDWRKEFIYIGPEPL